MKFWSVNALEKILSRNFKWYLSICYNFQILHLQPCWAVLVVLYNIKLFNTVQHIDYSFRCKQHWNRSLFWKYFGTIFVFIKHVIAEWLSAAEQKRWEEPIRFRNLQFTLKEKWMHGYEPQNFVTRHHMDDCSPEKGLFQKTLTNALTTWEKVIITDQWVV